MYDCAYYDEHDACDLKTTVPEGQVGIPDCKDPTFRRAMICCGCWKTKIHFKCFVTDLPE